MAMTDAPKPIQDDTTPPSKLDDQEWEAALKEIKSLQDQGVLDNQSDDPKQDDS